jgi:hypothetical protein
MLISAGYAEINNSFLAMIMLSRQAMFKKAYIIQIW